MMKLISICSVIMVIGFSATAQTEDAYETGEKTNSGLFDKSRLSVQHSLSFGMMSNSGVSNLKSQSIYGTMLQYQFVAPVTVNLNFGMPIHSTLMSAQNLSVENMKSLDYFKSMPIDFNLTWKPTKNTQLQFSIVKSNYQDAYGFGYSPYNRFLQLSRTSDNKDD